MSIDPQRLKEFLVSSELISEKDFNRAIEKSKKSNKKITEVLVEEKLVEQENLTKFERTDTAKKVASGAGIGLYLASQIIKAHNGKIWAESGGEGKGSVFFAELPV